jgi:ABC-2 type transport system ATP-binding protein
LTAAIEATGLSRRYGSVWALRDLSLRLPMGRVVALVGPNGAGKTTLLRLGVGLDAPSAGRIDVLGRSPRASQSELLPRIGFIAQDRPLYRRFTVADLFELGRRLNPRWDSALAHARVERLGINEARRVGELSGGQQAQIALTMVLAKQPELLLLDEPVAGLDPLARHEFLQGLMEGVAAGGPTVVLSSHVISELERTCDYLIILADGQVQVAGAIDDLIDSHRVQVGPPMAADDLAQDPSVIQFECTERQSTLLVKIDGLRHSPEWETHEVGLEELVLAYLARPDAGALPAPDVAPESR